VIRNACGVSHVWKIQATHQVVPFVSMTWLGNQAVRLIKWPQCVRTIVSMKINMKKRSIFNVHVWPTCFSQSA
jgi:hypothetical protein